MWSIPVVKMEGKKDFLTRLQVEKTFLCVCDYPRAALGIQGRRELHCGGHKERHLGLRSRVYQQPPAGTPGAPCRVRLSLQAGGWEGRVLKPGLSCSGNLCPATPPGALQLPHNQAVPFILSLLPGLSPTCTHSGDPPITSSSLTHITLNRSTGCWCQFNINRALQLGVQ